MFSTSVGQPTTRIPMGLTQAVLLDARLSARTFVPAIENSADLGLYFYDETAVSDHYLRAGTLSVTVLERGTASLDTETFWSFEDAGQFVGVIEDRQGTKIGCIEGLRGSNIHLYPNHSGDFVS